MPRPDCNLELRRAFEGLPKDMLEKIEKQVREAKKLPDGDQLVNDLKNNLVSEARSQRITKIQEATKTLELRAMVQDPQRFKTPSEGMEALATTIDRATEGGSAGHEFTFGASHRQLANKTYEYIGDDGFRILKRQDPETDAMIADIYFKKVTGQEVPRDVPKDIERIAEGLIASSQKNLQAMRESGIPMYERADHIANQTHDRSRILQADREEWIEYVFKRIDKNKTFGTARKESDVRKALRDVYDNIVEEGETSGLGGVTGRRQLHFMDGQSWAEYNQRFGKGSLLESVKATIRGNAQSIANQRVFGNPNGRRTWKNLEQLVERDLVKKGETEKLRDWQKNRRKRRIREYQMFGNPDEAGSEIFGNAQANMRMVNDMALLGKAVFATMTDFAFAPAMTRSQLGSQGFGMMRHLKEFLEVLPSSKASKYAQAMDLEFNDMLADTFTRFGLDNSGVRGNAGLRSIHSGFMELSLIKPQTNRAKISNARTVSMIMAEESNKGFDQLNGRTQNTLKRHNITREDWDLIRTAKEDINGTEIISSERISELEGVSKTRKSDLRLKWSRMLHDLATVGSPESTIREQGFFTQGLGRDTFWGSVARMVSQYSTFSASVFRIARRVGMNNPDVKSGRFRDAFSNVDDLQILGKMSAQATMIAGAMVMTTDIMEGKNPARHFQTVNGVTVPTPKFLAESVSRGAMPLFAGHAFDVLRGEYQQYGRSALLGMAGPTLPLVDPALRIPSAAVDDLISVFDGDKKMTHKSVTQAFNLVMDRAPGGNLPYMKLIYNKLLATHLTEALNPDYKEKMEKKVKKDDMLFNPYSFMFGEE